jgi:hypothetical protein
MAIIDNDYLAWRESLLYRVPQALENHVWMGLCKEAFTAGKAAGRKAAAPSASGGEDDCDCMGAGQVYSHGEGWFTCAYCKGTGKAIEEPHPPSGASVSEQQVWEWTKPIRAVMGTLHDEIGWYAEAVTKPAEEALTAIEQALTQQHALSSPRQEGECADREFLGRVVRMEWEAWAREQPNQKPSWLTPWDQLTEPEREVDRRIGERIFSLSYVPFTTPQPAASTQGLPKFSVGDRVTWTNKFGTSFSGTIEECWSGPVRYRVALDDGTIAGVAYERELESLLTSPTTGADGVSHG